MNKDCEGCGLEDCEPRYHEDSDLMLCDFCFAKAVDKYEQDWENDYDETVDGDKEGV